MQPIPQAFPAQQHPTAPTPTSQKGTPALVGISGLEEPSNEHWFKMHGRHHKKDKKHAHAVTQICAANSTGHLILLP